MKGYIYQITGKNGSRYLGMTTQNPQLRLKQHQRNLKKWLNHEPICRSSLAMKDGYQFTVLEEREIKDRKELYQVESAYIKAIPCINVGSKGVKKMILRSGKII